MLLSTELSTGLLLIILALSVVSFIAAYGSFTFCLRVSKNQRDYRQLLLFMGELDDNLEALAASHKRLRSRVGMKELRARRKSANDDDEPMPEDWKKEMRRKLHTGEIKP